LLEQDSDSATWLDARLIRAALARFASSAPYDAAQVEASEETRRFDLERRVEGWVVEEDGEVASVFLSKHWAERRADVAVANGAAVVRLVQATITLRDAAREEERK
jgi:hypothetical protein